MPYQPAMEEDDVDALFFMYHFKKCYCPPHTAVTAVTVGVEVGGGG